MFSSPEVKASSELLPIATLNSPPATAPPIAFVPIPKLLPSVSCPLLLPANPPIKILSAAVVKYEPASVPIKTHWSPEVLRFPAALPIPIKPLLVPTPLTPVPSPIKTWSNPVVTALPA